MLKPGRRKSAQTGEAPVEKPRIRDVLQNKILKKPIVAKLPDQHKISRINQLSIMISKLEVQITLLKSR